MAIKLKILEIGTPQMRKTKYGEKEHNSIKVEGEWAGKYLGFFTSEETKKWKVGDEIEVESVEKKEYTAQDGTLKIAYNLKLPRNDMGKILARLEEIEGKITKLSLRVSALEPKREEADGVYEDPDVQAEAEKLRKENEEPPF